jgi:hypothetical protein
MRMSHSNSKNRWESDQAWDIGMLGRAETHNGKVVRV